MSSHRRPPAGDAGFFSLAGAVERHAVGTLVRVSVCVPDNARLVLDFGDHDQVVTDACVLLCGHIGTLKLLELGYTGPLIRRPRLACERADLRGGVPARTS
jgi:hypothetical protein